MKKGLSVLLIAAALFGFYGGATNLNDVLACKDYFTASSGGGDDMQKLEDGLKQLKENEQAYLDGQEQLAEGEVTLAEGYATLADGEKQYAEGLASYKAAPAQLAEGKEGLASLKKAIKGINDLLSASSGYKPKWSKPFSDLQDARKQLYEGTKGMKDSFTQLAAFLPAAEQSNFIAAVKDVAGDDGKQTEKDYREFLKSTHVLAQDIPVITATVNQMYAGANQLYNGLKATPDNFTFAKAVSANKASLLTMAQLIASTNGAAAAQSYTSGVNSIASAYEETYPSTVNAMLNAYQNPQTGEQLPCEFKYYAVAGNIYQNYGQALTQAGVLPANPQQAMAILIGWVKNPSSIPAPVQQMGIDSSAIKAGLAQVKAQIEQGVQDAMNNNDTLTAGKTQLVKSYAKEGDGGVIGSVVAGLKTISDTLNGPDVQTKLLKNGLVKLNETVDKNQKEDDKNRDVPLQLREGQDDTVADGVRQLVSGILGDATMKNALVKKVGKAKVNKMKKYGTKNSPLYSKNSDFNQFKNLMESDPDVLVFLANALPIVRARLAQGQKEYAEGLAAYKSAPAQLADARQQLADGRQQLADGEKQLEDGRKQLAAYEDGEQQVRDGLATLVGTDLGGGVPSIAERIGNDTDFDNGDEHLDLDEGLAAVEAGKGYVSDYTAAVTDEIMNRAVSTGILLGASVLAVLAAILAFLKKYKGAGVIGILAAIGAAIGAIMGTGAGDTFSKIAGSTAGSTPWIAAGVLAVISAIAAVVYFTAKKEPAKEA